MYAYAESERNSCVIIFVTRPPSLIMFFVKRLERLMIGVWKQPYPALHTVTDGVGVVGVLVMISRFYIYGVC